MVLPFLKLQDSAAMRFLLSVTLTSVAFAMVKIAKRGDFVSASSCCIDYGKAFFNLIRMAFDFDVD